MSLKRKAPVKFQENSKRQKSTVNVENFDENNTGYYHSNCQKLNNIMITCEECNKEFTEDCYNKHFESKICKQL